MNFHLTHLAYAGTGNKTTSFTLVFRTFLKSRPHDAP